MARDPKLIAARNILAATSGEGNKVTNTFYFNWNGAGTPVIADWDALIGKVKDFYITDPGTVGTTIGAHLGPQFSRVANAHEVALYQIDTADPHHYYGSPVHVATYSLPPAAGSTPLPNEVALCLSYRASYGTDPEHSGTTRPRASDRGRCYLGPFSTSDLQSVTLPDGSQYSNVSTSLLNIAKQAFDKLYNSTALINWALSVFSRKEGLFKIASQYAVDNLWDSQRRRGIRDALQTWTPL